MSQITPKTSWVSKLLIKTKIPESVVGAVGTILAIFTIPITIVLTLYTSKSTSEELNIVAISATLFGATGAYVVYYLLRETFSIQDAFLTASRERDLAKAEHLTLTKDHDNLKKKDDQQTRSFSDVAPAFNTLSKLLSRFDTQTAAYSNYVIAGLYQANQTKNPYIFDLEEEKGWWKEVEDAYFDLLSGLCDTAVKVISLKKGGTYQVISANIKTILGVSSPHNYYKPLRRSSLSLDERVNEDDNLKKKPLPVTKNRMYYHILNRRKTTPWFILPNPDARSLEEYLAQSKAIKNLDENVDYPEPNENALRFYKSCLVVPITGQKISNEGEHRDVGMEFNQDSDVLIGFFCIDSFTHEFDEEYDLQIMKQLANHASSTIRNYFIIEKVRETLKQRAEPPSQD